ncbi:YkgJ family cysteine cluster protein [Thermococcus argininiproducens]|uniref:YkgJ family cysteine cluster protein n=1 Tax=Thermococcus argininiproducens TaxID=2866384 RepID=A0A9E7MAQ1_9EURY|nr:YkgJ family cysteine cluster protein [Thermococcus argininiproducens]USH00299.1 YkgJ family cysteine cluster protein [Thermococcus argininiproducens]
MRFKPSPLTKDVNFECKFCLDCCRGRFIYLTLSDIEKIMKHSHDPQDFTLLTAEEGKIRFVLAYREWDLGCIFHDPETGKCKVHDYNPLICQIYPFMVSHQPLGIEGEKPFEYKGEKLWIYYDKNCPGVGEGQEIITREKIAELGMEFQKEFEKTDLDGLNKLLDGERDGASV